ncbi:MAG: MSCRAMM family adhesin SdrC [Actinomycetota bacterium]|nr:MSCRAMM family adhesin SdrC [Actinomycetota bacterium]
MSKRISIASGALVVLAAVFALMLAGAVPASAHHKDQHSQGPASASEDEGKGSEASQDAKDNDGDADSDSGTAYTEDDDTNDGNTPNNVPDDGDNAHPSGKDRSVENGGSGNQGSSESDPDDDGRGPDRSNGGPDKPNGSGGVDKADQDGNNGCGNDDDFEDDNEGWCGKPPKPAQAVTPAGPCDADATMPGTQPCVKGDDSKPCDADATMPGTQPCTPGATKPDVLPDVISHPARPEVDTDVLGERTERTEQPVTLAARQPSTQPLAGGVLPFTGASLLAFAGAGLILTGLGIIAARKR